MRFLPTYFCLRTSFSPAALPGKFNESGWLCWWLDQGAGFKEGFDAGEEYG